MQKHIDISETICYYKDNKERETKRSRKLQIRNPGTKRISKNLRKGGTDHRNSLTVFKKFSDRPEQNLTNFI